MSGLISDNLSLESSLKAFIAEKLSDSDRSEMSYRVRTIHKEIESFVDNAVAEFYMKNMKQIDKSN